MLKILKLKIKNLRVFLLKVFFPYKYELYLQRKAEEEKKREEERKNIEKFAMVGGTEFINKENKNKIDNIKESITFYLKKKKTGRTIVVKGISFEDVKNQYGEEYNFVEPMIKGAYDEWDGRGRLVKGFERWNL